MNDITNNDIDPSLLNDSDIYGKILDIELITKILPILNTSSNRDGIENGKARIDIDIPRVSNISRLMDASLLLLVSSINELLPCFIISFIGGGPLEPRSATLAHCFQTL